MQKKKVMVRKIVEFHPLQKVFTLTKAKKIKNLSNPYLIKL
jgi:hypothetical protein